MGALTTKHYAFRNRPWEIISKETISLKDPFFPLIRPEKSQKNILRILPVVGEEEWIGDNIRFFKSQWQHNTPLIKLALTSKYIIENILVQETFDYHKKITNNEAIISLLIDIEREKELSIILGSESDIKLISTIRSLDNLKKFFAIKTHRFNDTNETLGDVIDLTTEDLQNYSIIVATDISKKASIFHEKLRDFVDNDGELFTVLIPKPPVGFGSHLGSTVSVFADVINGKVKTKKTPLLIVDVNLAKIIPSTMKKLTITDPNSTTWLSQITKDETISNTMLIFDTNVRLKNANSSNTYFFNPSYQRAINAKVFIPITSFWNENRLYKSFDGKIIRTPTILQFLANPLSLIDFVFLLKIQLILRNYAKNLSVFKFLNNM